MLRTAKPKNPHPSHVAESDGIKTSLSVFDSVTTALLESRTCCSVVVVALTSYPLCIYRHNPKNAAILTNLRMLVNISVCLRNPHIIKPKLNISMNMNNPVSNCGILIYFLKSVIIFNLFDTKSKIMFLTYCRLYFFN